MDAVRETTTLIAADKVQGTDVFNNGGDRLGSVHDLMIDKQTGQVAYAILSFGGFLGVGSSYHPLPWSLLDTTRTSAAMSSRLTRASLRARLPIRSARTRPGAIPNMRASSTTTGAFQARFDAFSSSAPSGAARLMAKQGDGPLRRLVFLWRPARFRRKRDEP